MEAVLTFSRSDRMLLALGVICVALALALGHQSGISRGMPDVSRSPVVPGCENQDMGACAEEGRTLAAADIALGTARYFLFGTLVGDLGEPTRILATHGVALRSAGCLCCDPLLVAYNKSVLSWLRARQPDFVMPLAFY